MATAKADILLRVPMEMVLALDRLAEKALGNRSAVMRRMIAEGLDRELPGWRDADVEKQI